MKDTRNNKGSADEAIARIQADIDRYRQAIEDAEGALEEAVRELDELLEERFRKGEFEYV